MPTGLLSTGGKDFASATASTSTGSYLIPRRLLSTVIESVKQELVLRGLAANIFGPSDIPGRSLVVPFQVDGNFIDVDQVGEGATVPLTDSSFTNLTITPVKYGARVAITKEMDEDSLASLGDFYARDAGYQFAINEENLIVSALNTASSAASNDVANSNATLPLSDVTAAMQNLEANNYNPTHIICGVEVVNDIRNLGPAFEAHKSGGNSILNSRLPGTLYGMKVVTSNSVSAKLAYVIDARHAFVIAEKRPLTIERYSEPQNDTGYLVATQRLAVSSWRNNAVSEITTT